MILSSTHNIFGYLPLQDTPVLTRQPDRPGLEDGLGCLHCMTNARNLACLKPLTDLLTDLDDLVPTCPLCETGDSLYCHVIRLTAQTMSGLVRP